MIAAELNRLISFINSLQQEQPEVDLEKEIDECAKSDLCPDDCTFYEFACIARHFAEWGRKQVLQEIYEGKVKPVDKITAVWLDDESKDKEDK